MFDRALRPLRDAGKLGAVHFQFPPWGSPTKKAYDHIVECRERLPNDVISTEFRLAKWFDEERREATLQFERQHGFVHVVLDMPQGFANSIPPIWAVTNPKLAIVRFHGRNAETWDVKGQTAASNRFNYDYPDDELSTFVPRMRSLAEEVELVHGIFNNNFEDQGQRNAETVMDLFA
jgi:uncharacterized protein YecE (DUF72 family)